MALISVNNLTFNYEGNYDNVFEGVSFNIDTKWKLGLIGRNGRGKTTLLKLLMGEFEYRGSINTNTPFMYFPFDIPDDSLLCSEFIENFFPDIELWQIEKELSFLEVDLNILYRPFKSLSGGEKTKLMLGLLFVNDNKFLLIDEPTNNLDQKGREVVSNYLKSKEGFILVSHDRVFLNNTIEYTLSINKNSIEVAKGNYDVWQENMDRKEQFEQTQNKRLSKEIIDLEIAKKQTEKWSLKAESKKMGKDEKSGLKGDTGYLGRKAAKMMKRSKVLEKRMDNQIDGKKSLLLNHERNDNITMQPQKFNSEIIARFRDFSINYNDNIVFENLNMTLNAGDNLLLKGSNGSGKSSLLKLLIGENISYGGEFYLSNQSIISYLPQMSNHLTGNMEEFLEKNDIDKTLFMTILRKMGFDRAQFEKPFSSYSEGQKKKVLISNSLCQKAHLFIWDEPLNYIDIYSRIQIEKAVLEFSPTMIFVEHDAFFQKNVANKIIDLDEYSAKY